MSAPAPGHEGPAPPEAGGSGPRGGDRLFGALVLALLAAVAAAQWLTFQDYGLVYDDEVQRIYSEKVLAWYGSGFRDRGALAYKDLYVYGAFFEIVAGLASRVLPFGPYESRHLVVAAFALLGVAATCGLGTRLGGPRAGFLAGAALALTPVWVGHGLVNPKDIPFAALYAATLWASLRCRAALPRPPAREIVLLGVSAGAFLGVKVAGAFVLGLVAAHWAAGGLLATRGWKAAERRRALELLFLRLLGAGAIAWVVMLACWPWAQVRPLYRPVAAISTFTHFPPRGGVLFQGRLVGSDELPADYLAVWFASTLPEYWFLGLAAAVAVAAGALARRRVRALDLGRALDAGLLAAAALLPAVAAAALHSVLYDGNRQFLFLLPPLAALAGSGLSAAIEAAPRWGRAAIAALALLSAAITVRDLAALHPYQAVYFNRLIGGGLARASRDFETDYWGLSYREGVEWLLAHYQPPEGRKARVANCYAPFLTGYWLSRHPGAEERFETVGKDDPADVFLATTRYRCHERRPGRVIHRVEREGVPLLYVIDLGAGEG